MDTGNLKQRIMGAGLAIMYYLSLPQATLTESTAELLPHVFPNKVWEYDAKEKGYKIKGHATLYSSCEHNSKLKLELLF